MTKLVALPAFTDNYIWMLHDGQRAVVVDPGDAAPVQAALDAPRVFHTEGSLKAERGLPAETIRGLQSRGHRVDESHEPFGGGQAVWIDWEKGTLTGASDPRKDGIASGY